MKEALHLPPVWCSSICRNTMNEICVENCAIKRDCSGFDPKPNLTLADMPRFPTTKGMSREEKFTSVTVYLAKVVDHLNGIEDEHRSFIVHRPLQTINIGKPKAIVEVAASLQVLQEDLVDAETDSKPHPLTEAFSITSSVSESTTSKGNE